MLKYKLSLHIFRRDLRIFDNTALIHALRSSMQVIPCFIFDSRQLEDNPFRSDNALRFMTESLDALKDQLHAAGGKLFVFTGKPDEIVEKLILTQNIQAVYVNRDYTPFSIKRDDEIKAICHRHHVAFNDFDDALINAPGQVLKDDQNPYVIFTPFLRKSRLQEVRKPLECTMNNYHTEKISFEMPDKWVKEIKPNQAEGIFLKGGRNEALKLLERLTQLADYESKRNIPSESVTSFLSPHNKFGTVSVREVYFQAAMVLGTNHTLITELYWRDFFTHIAFYFPHVFGHSFHMQYDHIEWDTDNKKFKAWCDGNTGFPIVDAGMRQLNATGWMHNRVRMIVAGFLVKDLHTDWRKGEKYFAQKLIDYDPAVNNGNWQWAASTGCDAQPWFRIFNPWVQQKRYDPECLYIRQWIPELASLNNKTIHNWFKVHASEIEYPVPMVDHKTVSAFAKASYRMMSEK